MKEEDKYHLYDLQHTYERGYSRGFIDGIRMGALVRIELEKQIKEELNDEKTEA